MKTYAIRNRLNQELDLNYCAIDRKTMYFYTTFTHLIEVKRTEKEQYIWKEDTYQELKFAYALHQNGISLWDIDQFLNKDNLEVGYRILKILEEKRKMNIVAEKYVESKMQP